MSSTEGGCLFPAGGLDFGAGRAPAPLRALVIALSWAGEVDGIMLVAKAGGRWSPAPFCQMVGRWSKLRVPRCIGCRMSGEEEVDMDPPPTGVLAS